MHDPLRRLAAPLACALVLFACATPTPAEPVAALNTEDDVALHGYDPVAYFRDARATPGTAEHSLTWRGATWRFASAENRRLFEQEPERYAPRYGGYCAYAMSINRIADIDPDAWEIVDGKLYLNNNRAVHALWKVGKQGRIAKADGHWNAYPKREAAMEPAAPGAMP